MLKKILISIAIVLLISAPIVSSIGWLGNADRTYQNGIITCYLGALAPGMPSYFCGWQLKEGFVMDHSWLVNNQKEMNEYYTISGSPTATFTFTAK